MDLNLETTVDDEKLDEIVDEIKKYDVYDFITRVAALNVFPSNQNKCIIFDTLINALLCEDIKSYGSQNIMTAKKFANIISSCSKLNIAKGVDPIEMPFIQRIHFYGNRWVFSGINHSVAFNLQNYLDVLFKQDHNFHPEFVRKASLFFELMLSISTKIVEDLNYSLDTLKHYEEKEIKFSNNYGTLKAINAITFKVSEATNIVGEDVMKEIEVAFGESNEPKIGTGDNYNFFYHPFLRISKDEFIVLNPSMLGPFSVYYTLLLAKEYNEHNRLVNLYNNKIFYECKQYLKRLGHVKIKEKDLGFDLINTNNYKEVLMNVANDGILFVRFFCDDAINYKHKGMFSLYKIEVDGIDDRIEKLQKKVPQFVKHKIYQLNILNGFGRYVSYSFQERLADKTSTLTPFELQCVSINESKHELFLPRYMESKNRLLETELIQMAEFNYLTIYSENDYSFYLRDDVDVRKTVLFPGYGDSIDYIQKALKKEDRFLIEYPNSNYLREVIVNDLERNIYCDISKNEMALLNKFRNLYVWNICEPPKSDSDLNLKMSLLDLETYWLSECKNEIESKDFNVSSIVIKNTIKGSSDDFFVVKQDITEDLEDLLELKIVDDYIVEIIWTPEAFQSFIGNEHLREKQLISLIIKNLALFTNDKILIVGNKIFNNELKTKMYSLDFQKHHYLKPIDGKERVISKECTELLLDEIGDYLRETKKYGYGIISEKKDAVCKSIVAFLYEKLKIEISKYKLTPLIKAIYHDLEIVIYQMMLAHKRYAFDIACYPEKSEKIEKKYNHLNESSIALKFMLEYASSIHEEGDAFIGEMDYEYILAICALIIEWAHNSDLFFFNIISNHLEILKSGRIGFKKDSIERLAENNLDAARNKLNELSNPFVSVFSPKTELIKIEDLDKAFNSEYGYTYSQLYSCGIALIAIGEKKKGEIKQVTIDEVLLEISNITSIDYKLVEKIIGDLSLEQREDYLKPNKPYTPNDVYPWKFNRRLSFNRRPIIKRKGEAIWGSRQLYHCLLFTIDLISDGRFKAEQDEMKEYISRIANKRGNCFNDEVFDKINSIDGLLTFKKVKKINKRKIADENNLDLGDIDVLIINPKKKKIIVVETKDFTFSKTPYEMHRQYLNVFCDDDKNLCYISKHKKRVEWIKNHIADVIIEYKLDMIKWKVEDLLITSEPIVSNEYYHKKQKMLLYSEISDARIKSI